MRINEPVAADGLRQPQLFAAASILLGTILLLAGPPARRRTAALVACHSLTRTATAPAAFTASAAAVHSFFNPASDAWTMQRRQKTLLREAGAR